MLRLIFAVMLIGTTLTTYTQPTVIQTKVTSATSASSASITFTQTPAPGDLEFCDAVHNAGSGASIAFAAGFTATASGQINVSTTLAAKRAYHVVGASESPTIAMTTGATVGALIFGCEEVAYVDTSSPIMTDGCASSASPAALFSGPTLQPLAPTIASSLFAALGTLTDTPLGESVTNFDTSSGTLHARDQHSAPIYAFQSPFSAALQYSTAPSAAIACTTLFTPIITPFTIPIVPIVATPTPAPTATPTATPAPTPTPAGTGPTHVLVAGYGNGYAGPSTSVPIAFQAQWLSWVYVNSSTNAEYHAAGLKTIIYTNFWLLYPTDNPLTGYNDIKPSGPYADAAAKNCAGTPVTDPHYGTGYLNDPRVAHSVNVAQDRVGTFGTHGVVDAFFSDDTGSTGGLTNDPPCGYTWPAWLTALNALHSTVGSALGIKFFPNAINAYALSATPVNLAGVTTPAAVLGAMCESCFVTHTGVDQNSSWVSDENAAIAVHNNSKIFWAYGNTGGGVDPASGAGQAIRLFQFGSFLLTYDNPALSMIQSAMLTPSAFRAFPEYAIVPTAPAITSTTTIAPYGLVSGVYARTFGTCFNGGTSFGGCKAVVNHTSGTVSLSTGTFSHTLVLHGGGVFEGGTVTLDGAPCVSLPAYSACIMVP